MNREQKIKSIYDAIRKLSQSKNSSEDAHWVETPASLVDEMISNINLNGKILVLFNVDIMLLLLKVYEVPASDIVFLSDDSVKDYLCDKKLGVKYINSIKELKEMNMKFDVVIGNPPYQHPTNKSIKIWTDFAVSAFELSKGSVIMVTPSAWLEKPTRRAFKDFTKKLSHHLIETHSDITEYFPNIGETIGYWHASVDEQTSFSVDEKKYNFSYSQQMITDKKELILVEKLKKAFGEYTTLRDVKVIDFYHSTAHAIARGHLSEEKTMEYDIPVFVTSNRTVYTKLNHIKPCYKLILNKSGYYYKETEKNRLMFIPKTKNYGVGENGVGIPTKSVDEANRARDIYSKKIFRFYIDNEKSSGFNSGLLDLPLVDFDKKWTDEDLYELFNLNKTDIKLIESHIESNIK